MPFADGDIPVSRSVLPEGEAGVDATVEKMSQMAKGVYGARSPKIRALAINVINQAKVANKDYFGMLQAIHNWVRDTIRYVRDPIGQETLSFPEETAFNSKAGDCLIGSTRLLTPTGYKTIADVRPGDVVFGRHGWTRVLNWWDKGVLPVRTYDLNNGGSFTVTDDHRVFLADGAETTAGSLRIEDALLGPSAIALPESAGSLSTADCRFVGLYLADGWTDANRLCISGKDGHPKEEQKRWVADYAAAKGWVTSWHPRYIRVYVPKTDAVWVLCGEEGKLAPDKVIPDDVISQLTIEKVRALVDGLMSDSHQPEHRKSGRCYSTISRAMALQMRLLLRLLGFSCSITEVADHGGLGLHPIYRVYPRFFQEKVARVAEIESAGNQHVFDIETEDKGIYLPDADVVVHNCDDMTILEMALLGSLGMQSYPVVVGMQPGRYSHVYLHAIVPPGKHRYAGATIAADPIMREWPLGKEAPASKVKAKKLYSELAGLGMTLGSYARGPAYIDERDVASVKPALNSKLTDTGSRGRIMNTAEVVRPWDDLDSMFVRGAEINMPFTEATRRDLYSLGPITARGEERMTSYLARPKTRKLTERQVGGRVGPNVVTVKNAKYKPAIAPAAAPTVTELKGLSDYLSAIESVARTAGKRQTVNGTGDILFKTAAATSLANERARAAAKQVGRVRYSMEMFGLGVEVDQNDVDLANSIARLATAVADKAVAVAKLAAGEAPDRKRMLLSVVKKLENAERVLGATSLANRMVPTGPYPAKNAGARVETITEMAHNPEINWLTEYAIAPIVDEVESPIETPLPNGSVVRDSRGNAMFADGPNGGADVSAMEMAGELGGLKKLIKKAKKVVQKVSPTAHLVKVTKDAIKKVATKSPIFKPLVKKSKVVRKVLGIKPTGGGGGGTETQYLDADGKPISKEEYDRQAAAASTQPTEVYEDENGNPLTKEQYDALMARYEAEYQAAVAAEQAARDAAQRPVTAPPLYAPTPTRAAPLPSNQPISPSYGGSFSMPSYGGSQPPIDTFGPEDMGPAQSADSFSSTQVNVDSYGQPGDDASEGSMTEDPGVQYDENGNPITDAPVAEPAQGGGFLPLALIGGAALYFFNK